MTRDGIAIVGVACVFPGASDAESFWTNVERGVDAIRDVPAGRWDPVYFDPSSSAPDRFYCRRGGFVDDEALFHPLRFGIPPAAAAVAEPDQLLTLEVAARALADAGYDDRPFDRDRTSVILGRGGYLGAGLGRLEQLVRGAQQLVESLRTLLPDLPEDRLAEIKADFQARLTGFGPGEAIGLVPNLAASRIANRLDLGGSAYTVDAACASSLVAVEHACRELHDGRADLALAGGVHLVQDECFWSVFTQLGALSRSGRIRPFHQDADGLLMGEGVGVCALKRVADADRDGDRVYAVIRSVGIASDGRSASLMTPAVDGQLLAVSRAWEQAGLDPGTVGLIEAHGTATPAGDAAELATLGRFFGPANGRRAVIGSVKSMIGHAMPAAGIAGLIKAALAIHHGVLPPTLHCEEPRAELADTRFRPIGEAEPWEGARRAGVNAFGFGGINAHAILDAHTSGGPARGRRRRSRAQHEELLVLAAGSREELLDALDGGSCDGAGPWRLAVANPTRERLDLAREAVTAGVARRGRDGIDVVPHGLVAAGGTIAFLLPGVEADFAPRVDDVAAELGLEAPSVGHGEELAARGIAVYEVARLLHSALAEVGVKPDLLAGHSLGEWTGMVLSGMLPAEEAEAFIGAVQAQGLQLPGFVFAAVGCGADRARAAIEGLGTVTLSHDNCPHQTIVCGREDEIDVAVDRLRSDRVLCQVLPFPRGGFHTPLFAGVAERCRGVFAEQPLQAPAVPLWSATTCRPYPDDPPAIRDLAVRHLVEPVRFRELLLSLHAAGARVFVQVGSGNLVGFVDDTLRGLEHRTIATNLPQRPGLVQLRRAATVLFLEGVPVRLDRLGLTARREAGMRLALGVPLVRFDRPLDTVHASPPAAAGDRVLGAFQESLAELRRAELDVVRAFAGASRSASPEPAAAVATDVRERHVFSLETYPELADHCFFPQPDGWPDAADRAPVMPMTGSIDLACELAARASGLVPVAIEHIRASRWIAAAPPLETDIAVRYDGKDRVEVAIEGHFEAVVRVAGGYPPPPAPSPARLRGERPPTLSAAEVYAQRWLFHGPAYQGLTTIDAMADDGARGELTTLPARGALLDAAGQLFGIWVSMNQEVAKLAMPVRVDRIDLFGPPPTVGERLTCVVRARTVGRQAVTCDIELVRDGAVYARIAGWQDWRFEFDGEIFEAIRFPERTLLASASPRGYVVVCGWQRLARTQDFLARRFLTGAERAELEALPEGRRAEWLYGRIAAKDAVRAMLFASGRDRVYPIEVGIERAPDGRPLVRGTGLGDVRVSLAHKDDIAVAIAMTGADPGIDVERIEARDESFARLAFDEQELALSPTGGRDEWLTRLWAAKEAAAKAAGARARVTAVDGERVLVGARWIETTREAGNIIAWTPP